MAAAPILLIEDDPSDARLIQRAFSKLDKTVSVIRLTHGDDAVAYLAGEIPFENRAAHPMPCVVLLDIKMPRRSGFEVLNWVRRQDTPLKRMPVVVLTSSRHSADINRAYDLGANSYLSKPDTSAKLHDLVSHIQQYWVEVNEGPDLHGGAPALR
jgi:CheY-like chemotaxis protein